jgi:hypothetical protein
MYDHRRMSLRTFFHRPQQTFVRRAIFQAHLWTGIGVGVYIFVICVTGSILVFRGDIQRILYPNLFYSNEKGSPTVHIATAVEKVKAAFPDHKLLGLEGPAETHDTFLGYIEKDQEIRSVFANPTTGDALGTLPDDDALRWLQDLHFYLLSGRRGLVINGFGALLLFLLCATGLVIWWPGIATWPRSPKDRFPKQLEACELGYTQRHRHLVGRTDCHVGHHRCIFRLSSIFSDRGNELFRADFVSADCIKEC